MTEKKEKKSYPRQQTYMIHYNEATFKIIEELAGKRFTWVQVADYFGISYEAIRDHRKRFPEIDLAYRRGRSNKLAKVVGNLFDQIEGGNFQATKYFLDKFKNWVDVAQESNNDEEKEPSNDALNTLDPIEASKRYQQIMTRGQKK